mgnify:CR=1 FL=1
MFGGGGGGGRRGAKQIGGGGGSGPVILSFSIGDTAAGAIAVDPIGDYPYGADGTSTPKPVVRCGQTVLTVNGATSTCETVKGYVTVDRTWQAGDEGMLDFDLPLVTHRRNHHVAFTRGPVVLARDSRFDDGDVDEALQESGADAKFTAEPERMQRPDMAMSVSVRLPVGSHAENHDGALWSTVRFCDFASAGNLWNPRNVYRVWLPVEYSRANENNGD